MFEEVELQATVCGSSLKIKRAKIIINSFKKEKLLYFVKCGTESCTLNLHGVRLVVYTLWATVCSEWHSLRGMLVVCATYALIPSMLLSV